MKIELFVAGFLSLCMSGYAQQSTNDLCGTYQDALGEMVLTKLVLNEDSTFELTEADPIFPYTHQQYTTTGRWSHDGKSVRLNQDLEPREVRVEVIERIVDTQDSITVIIHYFLEEYEQEELVSSHPFEFERLTLQLNNKRKAFNIYHEAKSRMCLFSPRSKNPLILDSTNMAKILREELSSISIFSYGFDEPAVIQIENKETNFLEIHITQAIDRERMPRNKEVIIGKKRAFYYERNGRIITSGLVDPLEKRN